jgi:predicted transcriptional regulator with HTH domain
MAEFVRAESLIEFTKLIEHHRKNGWQDYKMTRHYSKMANLSTVAKKG